MMDIGALFYPPPHSTKNKNAIWGSNPKKTPLQMLGCWVDGYL